MSEAKLELGRFGHHPDPAIDFCVEVEELEAIYADRCNKFANPDDGSLEERLGRALEFRVGGDLHAINAKDRLRKLSDDLTDDQMLRIQRLHAAAPDLYEALDGLIRAYRSTLDAGRERIVSLGGDCDDTAKMFASDPAIQVAVAALSKATPTPENVSG